MERNDHSLVAIQFLPIKLPNRGIDEKTKLDVLVRLVVVEVVRLVAAIVITKLQSFLKIVEGTLMEFGGDGGDVLFMIVEGTSLSYKVFFFFFQIMFNIFYLGHVNDCSS